MIKAIIFDFFGVLALRGTESFRRTHYANNQAKLKLHKEAEDKLNRGQIGYDDFISALAGLGEVDRKAVLKFTENYQPNVELSEYINKNLKPKYKIGIVSNAGQDWVLKILGDDYIKLFDDIVLSYKVGLIKPESEIYEIAARNLDVKPHECIFIDDILRYCQGAEAVGMNTIWYQDFKQFKNELAKILPAVADN